jgi:hypothetical protein
LFGPLAASLAANTTSRHQLLLLLLQPAIQCLWWWMQLPCASSRHDTARKHILGLPIMKNTVQLGIMWRLICCWQTSRHTTG